MANPLQQQALRRKVIYIGLVLVLFTAAFFFRKYGVEAYAQQLSLREQDRNHPIEIVGAKLRNMMPFLDPVTLPQPASV